MEQDDFYSQSHRGAKGLGLGSKAAPQTSRLAQPMAFVSASSTREQPKVATESDLNNEEFARLVKEKAGPAGGEPPSKKRRTLAPVDKEFSLAGASGFGLKYLQNLGFSGRLGKDEQGISQPIAVKQRDRGRGLAYGGFKEAASLRENKEIAREYFGHDGIVKGSDDESEEDKGWKVIPEEDEMEPVPKRKQRRPQRQYKSAMEAATEPQRPLIIDMRGPQTRVLSSFDSVRGVPTAEDSRKGKELLHNVNLIVDVSSQELHSVQSKLKSEKAEMEEMSVEMQHLGRVVEKSTHLKRGLTAFLEGLDRIDECLQNCAANVLPASEGLGIVARILEGLQFNHPKEYSKFRIWSVGDTHVRKLLERELSGWSPLGDRPERASEILRPWFGLFARDSSDASTVRVYSSIIRSVVMPKLQSALANQWKPKDGSEKVEALCKHTLPVLAKPERESMTLLVLNKLKFTLEHNWDPKTDPIPAHLWLFPWYEMLQDRLKQLFPIVKSKFAVALAGWHPSDTGMCDALIKWRGRMDNEQFAELLVRRVAPRLASLLRTEFEVDPSDQKLGPLKWVLYWRGVLPEKHLLCLIEGEFCWKWVSVLWSWLQSPSLNTAEVSHWYSGWKSFLESQFGGKMPNVLNRMFGAALDLMNKALTKQALPPASPLPASSYEASVRHHVASESSAARKFVPPHPPRPTEATATFLDVVEMVAREKGVDFFPKVGRVEGGNQVYKFGKDIVFLKSGVPFVRTAKGGGEVEWVPKSLEELGE